MSTNLSWKKNWDETQNNFLKWWNHEGLAFGSWGFPKGDIPHEETTLPEYDKSDYALLHKDPILRAKVNHHSLANGNFTLDCLPVADSDTGPGSLAIYTNTGCEPEFAPDTVWFTAPFMDMDDPTKSGKIEFDPENIWYKRAEDLLRIQAENGRGKYMAAFPDICEHFDILSALRDPQTLMFDVYEYPEWIKEKSAELNQVYFEAYTRLYDIIKLEDGSSAYGAFRLWGPGKTAKVQCDACSMLSPQTFDEFVLPYLTEQCDWLDYSMFHLDGTQCIVHLDSLLSIESLDAIEWTPQAGIESGGDKRWHEMFKKILDAGKSLQVVYPNEEDIVPMLDTIGGKGVYIIGGIADEAHAEKIREMIEPYR